MARTHTSKKWSNEETSTLVYLKRLNQSNVQIAQVLGRTEISIQEKLIRLNDELQLRFGQAWTVEEDNILVNDLMSGEEFRREYQRGQKETDMRRWILKGRPNETDQDKEMREDELDEMIQEVSPETAFTELELLLIDHIKSYPHLVQHIKQL